MRKQVLLLMFVFFSIFSFSPASASIFTCNSTGNEKTSFYTNETVYITSTTNITNQSKTIKFYVATHRTWSFGINLTAVANFSKTISTNSSGHVPVSVLWSPPLSIGNYDVIADMNGNTTFDSEDLLYNATGDGFSVVEQPVPKLIISKGEKSPSDHELTETNISLPNEMLQLQLTTGSYESIHVKSFYLSASGSGDDKNGIRYVAVCEDENKDGTCGFGEEIIGIAQYGRDDGIAHIDLKDGLKIAENSSVTLVFYYMMRNGSGDYEGKTYSFQLAIVEAFGSSGNRAVIEGLPIQSAVKTVYSQAVTTTTTTTTIAPTTTTTIAPTTAPPSQEKEEEEKINLFVGIVVAVFISLAIITVFYFFFLRPPQQPYTYKP